MDRSIAVLVRRNRRGLLSGRGPRDLHPPRRTDRSCRTCRGERVERARHGRDSSDPERIDLPATLAEAGPRASVSLRVAHAHWVRGAKHRYQSTRNSSDSGRHPPMMATRRLRSGAASSTKTRPRCDGAPGISPKRRRRSASPRAAAYLAANPDGLVDDRLLDERAEERRWLLGDMFAQTLVKSRSSATNQAALALLPVGGCLDRRARRSPNWAGPHVGPRAPRPPPTHPRRLLGR